jgi:elongation factor Ts
MATISAADVKKLRDLTGAGMMDSKNALTEADGDFDKAVEALRIKAGAKVNKLGAREATNGLIAAAEGAMIQLSCETDFVAKNEDFQTLAANIVAHAAAVKPKDVDALLEEKLADGKSVRENIETTSGVIGEKLVLSKLAVFDGQVATYLHRRNPDLPPQVGVLVEFTGDDLTAARGAAMRPVYVSRDEVPADVVADERRIAEATARGEGKPEQALSRIVEGRLGGFFKDTVLLEQASVQDSKKTVQQLLKDAGVTVTRFARFEVGA